MLTVGLFVAAQARGQTGLPVSSLTLSPSDQNSIRSYIQQHTPGLSSGAHTQAQTARDRLIEPVLGAASVEFRLYYSQQILPALEQTIRESADPWRVQLALTVVGAVATDAALELALGMIDDTRPAVRLAAAREHATLLDQVDQNRAAIQQARLTAAVQRIARALAEEDDPLVAGEFVKALATPVRTPALQNETLPAMCINLAAWLDANTPDAPADVLTEAVSISLRAVKVARDQLVRRQIAGDAPRALNEAATRLASAAGALAQRAANDAALREDDRTLARRLADASKSLTDLARGLGRR